MELLARRGIRTHDGAEQRLGVGMFGILKQLDDGCLFRHLAQIHDDDEVGQLGDDGQVMGDHDHAHVQVLLQAADQAQDLGLDGHVEGGGRFVGDQHARFTAEGDGDHYALAHAAAHLVGIVGKAAFGIGNAHLVEHGNGQFLGFLFRQVLVLADAFHDLFADGIDRCQRCHRLLEDHGNIFAANITNGVPSGIQVYQIDGLVVAIGVIEDLAACLAGMEQAQNRACGDALAAAALADDAQTAAAFDGKVDAVHCAHDAGQHFEMYVQIKDFENRLRIGHSQIPVASGQCRREKKRNVAII